MTSPLLVTGGTGTIGSRVVPIIRERYGNVRVAVRHPGAGEPGVQHVAADTVSGRGLAEAFGGVDTVLHLAGGAKGDDIAARNIAALAREHEVNHIVLISVIGADRMPLGYFRAKAAAERAIAESGVPFTVVRAAQLHDFVLPVVRMVSRLPLLPVPGGVRFEPVHVDEVAARLAELALAAPAGRVADLAGPQVLGIRQLADTYRAAMDARRRPGVPLRVPGAVGRAYRAGENLARGSAQRGQRTWDEFLSERL